MESTSVIFHRLPGESYSAMKERFEKLLEDVKPHMDKTYSGDTLRNVPGSDRIQIRNVKQRGVVCWPVLEYWHRIYMPKPEAVEL